MRSAICSATLISMLGLTPRCFDKFVSVVGLMRVQSIGSIDRFAKISRVGLCNESQKMFDQTLPQVRVE